MCSLLLVCLVGSKGSVDLGKRPGLPGLPCQAAGCAKPGAAMAKAKQGGGWSWAPSRPLGGQAGSRGLPLCKATARFSYKMAEGCVGHFVAPLQDKGRESQRVGPVDAWRGGGTIA